MRRPILFEPIFAITTGLIGGLLTYLVAANVSFFNNPVAKDAANGTALWSFPTNRSWKASPMTYMFDGKQVVAVAAGPNIIALTIHDQ